VTVRTVNARLALPYLLAVVLALPFMMSGNDPKSHCAAADEIVAAPTAHEFRLDAQHPSPQWQAASPVTFCSDWQGKNPDPARQTEVRTLWSPQTLYLRFECRYRELYLFTDSEPTGRRNHLWDRDVAEAFLQPDPSRPRYYKEFEVSPNGLWIDLDISPGPLQDLKSGMQRSVWLDEAAKIWMAELAIPMKSLTPRFDPAAVWRVNFYRIEGSKEPRFYSAWQPTNTPEPNFHVPSAFGHMRFLSHRRSAV
jgi:alpha-galactosidase